jgi:hypothetical protein
MQEHARTIIIIIQPECQFSWFVPCRSRHLPAQFGAPRNPRLLLALKCMTLRQLKSIQAKP